MLLIDNSIRRLYNKYHNNSHHPLFVEIAEHKLVAVVVGNTLVVGEDLVGSNLVVEDLVGNTLVGVDLVVGLADNIAGTLNY
ncbi:hypothetical protein MOSE0_L05468 [Monosporozyma servazzii]